MNENEILTDPDDPNEEGSGSFDDVNFNVDDEYKPDPLVPRGTYHGVVTKVYPVFTKYCIVWDICLHDNGGVMNDGETPIDGVRVSFRNWLPKPGDELEMTKSGRSTKRQSKINMLKDFETELAISMATPQVIATSLAEAIWIGIEVSVEVDADEWNGRFRNVVNRMKRSTTF